MNFDSLRQYIHLIIIYLSILFYSGIVNVEVNVRENINFSLQSPSKIRIFPIFIQYINAYP